MKNKVTIVLFFSLIIPASSLCSIISFFLRPYPDWNETAQHIAEKIVKPGKTAQYYMDAITHETLATGIFATYGGFIQSASVDDEIVFPRKHTNPLLYIVVTPQIVPIIMFELTIHHLEFDRSQKTAFYKAVRKPSSTNPKELVWEINPEELPADNRIPLESIVIFAKPSYIEVPTGTIPTLNNPNLLLPDIYVKKGINVVNNAFYVLTINNFFRPVETAYKKEPLRVISTTVGD